MFPALQCLQGVEQCQLGRDEKVDLCRRERRILEMAGRAGVPSLQPVVMMEKVDAERKEKENQQEADVEADPVSMKHVRICSSEIF